MPILYGTPNIDVKLRVSARARRFSLRVSQLDGRVTLSMPQGPSQVQVDQFLHDHEGWIRAALAKMVHLSSVAPQVLAFGRGLPVEGRLLMVSKGAARGVSIVGQKLLVSGDEAQLPRRLAAFLRARARDRLAAACDYYAARLGKPYISLSLRDTRSRWGSCTSRGGLMFSWRLIMAPIAVLDYVVAHEVAHLAHMNHSPRFWAEVRKLCPDYQVQRDWLKVHGQSLHRYGFTAQDETNTLERS
ncbi:MAG: putative metal-dependent hydrolase [Paracoccaceae bacterium]|jgi:predicted metal-dependent hydrolase